MSLQRREPVSESLSPCVLLPPCHLPSPQVGGIFNLGKAAAPTLSISAGGIGAARRVTIDSLVRQRVIAQRLEPVLSLRQPAQVHFADGCMHEVLSGLRCLGARAFVVTDECVKGNSEEAEG